MEQVAAFASIDRKKDEEGILWMSIWLLFKFLIATPFLKQQSGSLLRTIIYLLMAIVFWVMEITGEKVDVYTIVRGFVVLGGVDVSLENLFLWLKEKRK